MTSQLTETDLFADDFARVLERAAAGPQGRFRALREHAMERFRDLGFPTLRDEEWRFTNLKGLKRTPFAIASPDGADRVSPEIAVAPGSAGEEAARLVFVDGHFAPGLSHTAGLPAGAEAGSVAEAIRAGREPVASRLGAQLDYSDDAFCALNTAFLEDGGYVHVGPDVAVRAPIHLLFLATAGEEPTMTQTRNLVVAERGAKASVVESYYSLGDGVCFSNAVTEAELASSANVAHYLLELESESAYQVATLRTHQEGDSQLDSHSALIGGGLVRNNVHAELHGEGADLLVNGLFLGGGQQHHDNHMRVVHAEPRCHSRQFYRGVMDEAAHGVFAGRIVVYPGAQQTDAKQSNQNLVLTDEAQINTKPQLEIYADDVKCTHGATTGQLDERAIFYMQARGIPPAAARRMLIEAFARESLDRMGDDAIREYVSGWLSERLGAGSGGRKEAS